MVTPFGTVFQLSDVLVPEVQKLRVSAAAIGDKPALEFGLGGDSASTAAFSSNAVHAVARWASDDSTVLCDSSFGCQSVGFVTTPSTSDSSLVVLGDPTAGAVLLERVAVQIE